MKTVKTVNDRFLLLLFVKKLRLILVNIKIIITISLFSVKALYTEQQMNETIIKWRIRK